MYCLQRWITIDHMIRINMDYILTQNRDTEQSNKVLPEAIRLAVICST